ncbi:MAG: hypothetical protein M1114_01570 [Candidatus Dependentiae bacterium]|nr:hypothetical protein [Candidatus Dependentiae bacterium]
MIHGFSLTKTTLLYAVSNKRLFVFVILGLMVGYTLALLSQKNGYFCFMSLLHALFIIGWKRSIASFIIQESYISPSSVAFALFKGFKSLAIVWWLTAWDILLFAGRCIILSDCCHQFGDIGLLMIVSLLVVSLLQMIADFFFTPLIADDIVQFYDLIGCTTMYIKYYWLTLLSAIAVLLPVLFLLIYLSAVIFFVLGASPLFFTQCALITIYFFFAILQTIFYIKVHYACEHK